MAEKEKLPVNVTFEVVQHAAPNDRWYDVTAVLSWTDPYEHRMETGMCWGKEEVEEFKEGTLMLIGDHFDIREVKEL